MFRSKFLSAFCDEVEYHCIVDRERLPFWVRFLRWIKAAN